MEFFTIKELDMYVKKYLKSKRQGTKNEHVLYTDIFGTYMSISSISGYIAGDHHPSLSREKFIGLLKTDILDAIIPLCKNTKESDLSNLRNNLTNAKNFKQYPDALNEFNSAKDFCALLASAIYWVFDTEADTFKSYESEIIAEREKEDLKEKRSKSTTISLLSAISQNMNSSIAKNTNRYHADDIQDSLLSHGHLNDSTAAESNEQPLMDLFLSCTENLYIDGEGGIGKTTFLVQLIKKYATDNDDYLPLFFPLPDLKKYAVGCWQEDMEEDSYVIRALWDRYSKTQDRITNATRNKIDYNDFQKMMTDFFSDKEHLPRVLLILDGINEISLEKNSAIRSRLLTEIENLSQYANIRIVASSRPLADDITLCLYNFKKTKATGIPSEKLQNILASEAKTKPSDDIREILRIPLFLKMYLSVQKTKHTEAASRGAILFDYYNTLSALYSEKGREYQLIKNDPERTDAIPMILDFILPAFAARMEMEDTFSLSRSVLKEIVQKKECLVAPFEENTPSVYSSYVKDGSFICDKMNTMPDTSNVIKLIQDRLSLFNIYEDVNDELSFTHQYIRDYFAAMFKINALLSSQLCNKSVYSKYMACSLSDETTSLTSDILHYSRHFDGAAIMKDSLIRIKECTTPLTLTNVLNQLSSYYNDDLSSLHFDGINFSGQKMTDYKFYNYQSKCSATFSECNFSSGSFGSGDGRRLVLHTVAFSPQPVICELIICSPVSTYRVLNMETMATIYSVDIDLCKFPEGDVFSIFECDSIQISPDMNTLLLYQQDFIQKAYCLFDIPRQECVIQREQNAKTITFRLQNEFLLSVKNNNCFIKQDIKNLTKQSQQIKDVYDYKYNEYFSGFNVLPPVHTMIFENGDVLFERSFAQANDRYLFYSQKNNTTYHLSFAKEPNLNLKISHYRNAFVYDDMIYIVFRNSIYRKKASSDDKLEKFISGEFDMAARNMIAAHDQRLYVITCAYLYIYDINGGNLLNEYYISGFNPHVYMHVSENYCVLSEPQNMEQPLVGNEFFRLFKTGCHDYSPIEYKCALKLKKALPFKDNTYLLSYDTNYIVKIDKNTFDLLDCAKIHPDDYIDFFHYNKNANQLAIIQEEMPYDHSFIRHLKIFYADHYDDAIKSFPGGIDSNFEFSLDGAWFFIIPFHNNPLEIYDTQSFTLIKTIPLHGTLAYLLPREKGMDIVCKKKKKDETGEDYFHLRITIDPSRNVNVKKYSVPAKWDFSPERFAITKVVSGLFMVKNKSAYPKLTHEEQKIKIENDIIDFQNTYAGKHDITSMDYFFVSSGASQQTEDIIKENMIISLENNQYRFYSLTDNKIKVTIRGMQINKNCHYDTDNNWFVGQSNLNIFTAIDLKTEARIAESRFTPGLLIKGCIFKNCTFDDANATRLIKNNGGIIE